MRWRSRSARPSLAIDQGYSVPVTEPDGQIQWRTDRGLYFWDSRLIGMQLDARDGRLYVDPALPDGLPT